MSPASAFAFQPNQDDRWPQPQTGHWASENVVFLRPTAVTGATFSGVAETPAVDSMFERLRMLVSLPTNWDSYGARRVDPKSARDSFITLLGLMRANTPPPTLVPTPVGTIQAEWHMNGIDLEVEFLSPSRLHVSYDNQRDGISWNDELTYDLTRLSSFIDGLNRV